MPIARGREIASTGCRHHPDASPQTERYRKRRCPTADSKAHAIDTAFGHGRPPVCFLSRQLESSRGGPGPPFHLDAILLSKCARNCTLPSELLHLLLVGEEFFGHRRSSRKIKGEPAGSPPVPGIESFWTLITSMILSANLSPVKAHALTIHAQS